MWKYAVSRGVSGTPTAFVNGIQLQNFPGTVNDWLNLLKDVVNSQYTSKSAF